MNELYAEPGAPMAIAVRSFKPQRFFSWIVTPLCLLAAIAYVTAPANLGDATGAKLLQSAAQTQLFRVLVLLAAASAAGWFAYAFTGDPTLRREEQVKFSYFFVIASFAVVTVPPFVKSQAIGSEPIGIISGCVKDAAAAQLGCDFAAATTAQDRTAADSRSGDGGAATAGPPAADATYRNQWLVNIGGALAPQNPAKCPPDAKIECKVGSQDNRAIVTGGLVVPLPFVIIALFGGAISLSRRIPEIQKRSEPGYVGTQEAPALLMWEAREELAFQILQFLSAPLIAIVAHQLIEPASQTSAVALAFLAGFGSETILLMIRGIADGIQPKSIALQSPAIAPAAGAAPAILPAGDGGTAADSPAGAAAGSPSRQGALERVRMAALETRSANIRLGIDVDALDPGSLALTVNGARAEVTPDGLAELPLEVGREYRLEASGRRAGQVVRGKLELKVTVDDEDSLHELTLA